MLFHKMLHDLPADGLSLFKFAQKNDRDTGDFLTAHSRADCQAAWLSKKALEPGCERTAEKTGCHGLIFSGHGSATSRILRSGLYR